MTIAQVKGFMTERLESRPDLYSIKVKIKNGNVYSRSPFSLEARNALLADLHKHDMKLLLCSDWTKRSVRKTAAEVKSMVEAVDDQLPAEYHDDDSDEIPF